ncbi:MAG: hypothetical protein JWQ09_2921, partial [Segetibacter sp.]|nr:hypothetical protein [Segetibacter sp.]
MKKELIEFIQKDCEMSFNANSTALTQLQNQVILITGGTGFMGKWLAELVSFLNERHDYNIKLFLLAEDIDKFKEEVPHLSNKSFIELIEQDIKNVAELNSEISFVIHAAGSPDNRDHSTQPIKTIDTIYKGTQAILEACVRLPNLQKFVFISSNYVYGKIEQNKNISENDFGPLQCNSVTAAYAEAKRLAETICTVYRNQRRLPIVIIRPFAFIGPYQNIEKPWAINNFIRDGLLGGPIRILGNENTIRSYLYGSDLACWLLNLLISGKVGKAYNLGSEEAISIKDLAEKIVSLFDNNLNIVIKSSKEFSNAPSIAVPNISLLKKDVD